MKKKGFTLIELLAIIVILAIIVVITVPLILNIIDDASKNAAISSAYGYKEAISKYYATKLLQNKDYIIPNGAYFVDGDTGHLEGTETLAIAVSGKIPSFGKVIIGTGSKVEEANLCINNYMILIRDDEDISAVKGCTPVEPGLYDQNNNLVVSYDYLVSEYGFDPSIDRNYNSRDVNNDILANYSDGVKLVFPDTVTSIGIYAFYENKNLTSVTIPSSVTSIGNDAFSWSGLTSITIPSSVTSIGDWAFDYCENLINVTFESGSQLTSIGNYAFEGSGLTSITIPSSVTSIGSYAFSNIKIVYYTGSATGSPWGAISVNPYVEGDFVYSDNTKTVLQAYIGTSSSVTIPSGVTSIGDKAFYKNKNITSITIPSSVTSIGVSAFYYCENLTNVTFESGSQLTSIGNSAFSLTGLTSITIPSSTTSIGNGAFNDIKIVYYTGSATGSPWGANSVNPYVEGDFVYSDNTKTTLQAYLGTASSVTIPSGVTSIGDKVFYQNKNLISVTIPSGVTSIGNYAFYSDDGLTSVTIPSSVTSIGNYAFDYCENLTNVTFESGSQLTSIGSYAFGYVNMISITIPSSVTSIGSYAFSNIKIVYYTGSATGSPWGANCVNPYIEGDFVYSDSTKKVLKAYLGTASSVTIPSGVTSIGDKAFYENKNLTSITIPSSVTSIGNDAFAICKSLTSVMISPGLKSIGMFAFAGDTNLTSITIPSSVTSIKLYAFNGVGTVYYSGSASGSPWGANQVIRN